MFRNANKFFEFFFDYSIIEMSNTTRISTKTEINLFHINNKIIYSTFYLMTNIIDVTYYQKIPGIENSQGFS